MTSEGWIGFCFIQQIIFGVNYGVEVYLHAFLTTALDGDVPLTSSDIYFHS